MEFTTVTGEGDVLPTIIMNNRLSVEIRNKYKELQRLVKKYLLEQKSPN